MPDAVTVARLMLSENAGSRSLWRHAVLHLLDEYEAARRRGADASALARA